jgi:hypothetical protein
LKCNTGSNNPNARSGHTLNRSKAFLYMMGGVVEGAPASATGLHMLDPSRNLYFFLFSFFFFA